jgi:ubiquitin carboxyl-terminal hydrolase 4/11/15
MQIYKVPPVLVISLKRFKAGKSKFSMSSSWSSGGNGKLGTLVDFNIKGLDLTEYVLYQSGEKVIYDLFAVSNHYGGCGGGHYTAYAMNWRDQQWYGYDDSSVSKTTAARVVTEGAYNIFYRKRGAVEFGTAGEVDYDMLKQSPKE